MSNLSYSFFNSPIGTLKIGCNSDFLISIDFLNNHEEEKSILTEIQIEVHNQLEKYFLKTLVDFTVPLAPVGTAFQIEVWELLKKIPYGQTKSYLDIARELNNEKVIRAVGMANGQNPIPIVIPCHRVIGSDGSLTGYSGGLDKKVFLLQLEGSLANNQMSLF